MTRNPVANALAALVYIVLVVTLIFNSAFVFGQEDNILIPITMLSLFVFSAASMGYIFLYQPLMLFLEGHKKEAVNLFLTTLAAFAVSAVVLVSAGLYITTYL